jgi:membrane-bound serine protease (ClpP class)
MSAFAGAVLAMAVAAATTGAQEVADRPAPDAGGPALVRIVVDGAINPAVADFVHEAIARARDEEAAALVIQLDTPGGLLPSTRAIVKDVLSAPLPVIVYVAPSGAGAGSAGMFITLAGHVAAMAPGTNIGAAHPVGGQGQEIEGPLGEKIESFTTSFSEAIARQRGRNVEWAARAVRESVSIAADEAARLKVVDFVAKDLDDVVRLAEGRTVEVAGERRKLRLGAVRAPDGSLRVRDHEMRIAQRILDVLADPNIAYLLMMAGVLGLYLEFTNPGLMFPGIAGAISLVLGLTALHVLPVNTSGLALLGLGVVLLIAEAFVPTFGLLGIGGVVAFLLGSLFLFDTAETGVAVSRGLVFGVGGVLAATILAVGALVVRAHRRRAALGVEGMIGQTGVVRQRIAPQGGVLVRGEYWTAESDEVIEPGERVEVTAVDGLRLRVRRARRGGDACR